jgi:hypothetical protein
LLPLAGDVITSTLVRSIFRRICETDANTNQRAATTENKHINNGEHEIMQRHGGASAPLWAALAARKLSAVIAKALVSAPDLSRLLFQQLELLFTDFRSGKTQWTRRECSTFSHGRAF